MTDIEHLIRYGRVADITRPSSCWRYRIEGVLVDGKTAACVVEFNGQLLEFVTAFLLSCLTRSRWNARKEEARQ